MQLEKQLFVKTKRKKYFQSSLTYLLNIVKMKNFI